MNFKVDTENYKSINLSIFNNFVREIMLDDGISQIFSSKITFISSKLKFFRLGNSFTPYYQTTSQSVSGIYGKNKEGSYYLPFRIKINRSNMEFQQKLHLYGIPFSLSLWDSEDNKNINALLKLQKF